MNGVLQPIKLFSDKWSWLFESPIELIVHLAEFRNRRCKKFLVQSKKTSVVQAPIGVSINLLRKDDCSFKSRRENI